MFYKHRYENGAGVEEIGQLTQRASQCGGYLVVHVPLPFQLPLESGLVLLWGENEDRHLELAHYPRVELFKQGEPCLNDLEPEAKRVPPEINASYTVARFSRFIPLSDMKDYGPLTMNPEIIENEDSENLAQNQAVNELIEEGLRALNSIVRAHRIVTWDVAIYPLSMPDKVASFPANVASVLLCTMWDVQNVEALGLGTDPLSRSDIELLDKFLHVLHFGESADREVASRQNTKTILDLAVLALHNDPHPFFVAADLIRSSRTKGGSGDYNATIIECVTGVETFVSTLLRLYLEHENYNQGYVNNVLFKSGLKNLFKQHLGPLLNFGFNENSPSNPVDIWYASSYEFRNLIVHRGHFATREEAQIVFAESLELIDFLTEQLKRQSNKFAYLLPLISE